MLLAYSIDGLVISEHYLTEWENYSLSAKFVMQAMYNINIYGVCWKAIICIESYIIFAKVLGLHTLTLSLLH